MKIDENLEEVELLPEKTLEILREIVKMDWPYNAPDIGENHPGWQTGLAQLYFYMLHAPQLAVDGNIDAIFYEDETPQFLGMAETKFLPTKQIPRLKLSINPGSLIYEFLHPSMFNPYDENQVNIVPDEIAEAIKQENGKWLLCGAMSPRSIICLLNTLSKEGFSGDLDVVDSNPFSKLAFQAIEKFIISKYPQIKVNFIKGNLLKCSLDKEPHSARASDDGEEVFLSLGYYNGMCADTIGAYFLDDADILDHFAVVFGSLSKRGIAFVRDMTEGLSSLNVQNRHINPSRQTSKPGETLSLYIANLLGILVPIEYCTAVISNLFSGTQANRWGYLRSLWEEAMPTHTCATYEFAVPGVDVSERYFASMLFSPRQIQQRD